MTVLKRKPPAGYFSLGQVALDGYRSCPACLQMELMLESAMRAAVHR